MCDLKRQQISLGTRHRNSRRTWIANLLYRFTGGRLILEGWHRASDISSSAEGLNKKDLFLHRPPVFEQRPRFSSFTVTCARAREVQNPFPPSYPSLSRVTPLYIYIFYPPPLLKNAPFRSETNPTNSGVTVPHSKKELVIESVIIVQGFFFYPSFLRQSHVYLYTLIHVACTCVIRETRLAAYTLYTTSISHCPSLAETKSKFRSKALI